MNFLWWYVTSLVRVLLPVVYLLEKEGEDIVTEEQLIGTTENWQPRLLVSGVQPLSEIRSGERGVGD